VVRDNNMKKIKYYKLQSGLEIRPAPGEKLFLSEHMGEGGIWEAWVMVFKDQDDAVYKNLEIRRYKATNIDEFVFICD
jgi:hypothetical protein